MIRQRISILSISLLKIFLKPGIMLNGFSAKMMEGFYVHWVQVIFYQKMLISFSILRFLGRSSYRESGWRWRVGWIMWSSLHSKLPEFKFFLMSTAVDITQARMSRLTVWPESLMVWSYRPSFQAWCCGNRRRSFELAFQAAKGWK